MNRAELEQRAQGWRRHHAWRQALIAISAAVVGACALIRVSPLAAALVGVTAGLGSFLFLRRRTPRITAETMAAHLNRLYPALEESAGLWLSEPTTLTLLERLQRQRLDAAWHALPDQRTAGAPHPSVLRRAIGLCAAAVVMMIIVAAWPRGSGPEIQSALTAPQADTKPGSAAVPALHAVVLEIEPPAYLGQPARNIQGLDAEAPAGSVLTWRFEVTGTITGVSLVSAAAAGEVSADRADATSFSARSTVVETQLYQIAITTQEGRRVVWPEVHVIKVIPDLPPKLTWQEPAASRTVVDPAVGAPRVLVQLNALDDHGLARVGLVMTVAKGSGEGVKFREQEITLERSGPAATGGDTFARTLDLTALGLEPGDELYFHAVATDRRTPAPNQARTETRFVVLRGPTTELAAPPVGLAGVNRLPQYFRSQRQLIIDTERLIAERAGLSETTFRERSEEIGIDQKLLRLRYGQFLGEEFEPPSSGAPKEAQGMALAGALRGESRESLNRTAAVERAVEAQHAHPAPQDRDGRSPTVEELIAPFVHVHDNPEAATLFNDHVKTALRAVLAAMWVAEGFLRTGRPADALPAENRALELLKALQQADRVYVKRVGYEPAPIKVDERRLRGELDAIPKRAVSTPSAAPEDAETKAVSAAINTLDAISASPVSTNTAASVEARLVAKAQERPEAFLAALELWRRHVAAPLPAAERAPLRHALWSLLPPATESPRRSDEPSPALANAYAESLNAPPAARSP